ncbi:2-dehydropantoate 2-reductase [Minwuia thermotolerans]|uniref:2-dehydropantoate 2-reductase n=1 Tax=Minwuia thermotolerans TaxID=2056226 RepID=A0A2M9FXR1_9PROT|nr:2-dehydropantoate 2-reductase [Minwuia thermotolerans]PJK28240.1 2-dehydropantoate 2-reductase [Minwuia thermotolerans]
MKICVMGAGGLGGFFGGWLAAAGEEVSFVARGDHLRAMQANGLTVRSALGDRAVSPVRATDDPGVIGPVDVVLFCVKTYHLEEAAPRCRPLLGPETAVISVLNGVEAPERLGAILGPAHVVPGLTYVPAAIAAPGVIEHKGDAAGLVFGEADGRENPRLLAFRDACRGAGIDARIEKDIMAALWTKLVLWCGTSGVTSFARSPFGAVRSSAEMREMYAALVAEAAAVARARGIALPRSVEADLLARLDAMPAEATSSTHRDLENGRPLELDAGLGAIVRLGREAGVATPMSARVLAALVPFAAGDSSRA